MSGSPDRPQPVRIAPRKARVRGGIADGRFGRGRAPWFHGGYAYLQHKVSQKGDPMKRIHINQHIIRRNHKTGEREPVITVKEGKTNEYAHAVEINGPSKLVYSPDKPLSCGARVWIETDSEVNLG